MSSSKVFFFFPNIGKNMSWANTGEKSLEISFQIRLSTD